MENTTEIKSKATIKDFIEFVVLMIVTVSFIIVVTRVWG